MEVPVQTSSSSIEINVDKRKPLATRPEGQLPSHSSENVLFSTTISSRGGLGVTHVERGERSTTSKDSKEAGLTGRSSTRSSAMPADSLRTVGTEPTEGTRGSASYTANNKRSQYHGGGGSTGATSLSENMPLPRNEAGGGPQRPPIDRLSSSAKGRAAASNTSNVIPRNPKDTSSPNKHRSTKVINSSRDSSIASAGNRSLGNRSAGNQSARSSPLPPTSSPSSRRRNNTNNSQWIHKPNHPEDQEQALFEQRLCEDALGVAVRKINQNGKANLRYVKCIPLVDNETGSFAETRSAKSVSSFVRGLSSRRSNNGQEMTNDESGDGRGAGADNNQSLHNLLNGSVLSKQKRALTWGKKKDAIVSLDKFVRVRTGKTTYRTKRNINPSTRLLSLITKDTDHTSLDIEAPTKLDRDKFAKAFARFLNIPLEMDSTEVSGGSLADNARTPGKRQIATNTAATSGGAAHQHISAAHSAPDINSPTNRNVKQMEVEQAPPKPKNVVVSAASESLGERLHMQVDSSARTKSATTDKMMASQSAAAIAFNSASNGKQKTESNIVNSTSLSLNIGSSSAPTNQTIPDMQQQGEKHHHHHHHHHNDDGAEEGTVVSSLTGAGFDQEIVEEMHQAMTELKAELEASRAEAARAVKVAEQAIQSAEKCNSKDWNSTVTHKAAEAAAQAQKRSAEAIAKQRLAEERLAGERRSAAFWKKQAEVAEEEAGVLQTRAAAAEVQRASMAEELESERCKAALHVSSLKQRYSSAEVHQREALDAAMERNRALEIELGGTRKDLVSKQDETKVLQDALSDLNTTMENGSSVRKKLSLYGRKKKGHDLKKSRDATSLLGNDSSSSYSHLPLSLEIKESGSMEAVNSESVLNAESVLKLHAEASAVRQQFELLRRATADELRTLPETAMGWANQASEALTASQSEIVRLRQKLALESSTRRKLLHQVQDLRGSVRVYCRPLVYNGPCNLKSSASLRTNGILSFPSQETILLHSERSITLSKDVVDVKNTTPISFEFDRVFDPETKQNDIYTEVEELVLGMMDGYKVCITTLGQTGSGCTHTLLGDVNFSKASKTGEESKVTLEKYGIHLQAAQQLFNVAEHRNAKYEDVFSITILEVHNERLCDLIAGTEIGNERGQIIIEETKADGSKKGHKNRSRANTDDDGSFSQQCASAASSKGSKPNKLEIRTNHEGETIVQGLMSVPVSSFGDVLQVWQESLKNRVDRLTEQGVDITEHEATSHIITTLKVVSTNMATGIGTVGKIQFVDLAGTDLVSRIPPSDGPSKTTAPDSLMAPVGNNNEWKFANKSLTTLGEVVSARCQFLRTVPYRNSTITHLLSDSLEADTKFLLIACVSSDPKNLQETACALRLASRMRRIQVGKATKKFITSSSVL